MTDAEITDLRDQVAQCWNVGGLSTETVQTLVTVTFELGANGVPLAHSVPLIGAGKDTSDAVKSAYSAARRAIIRCGAKGYKLPLEKYEEWRNIELIFNPERMVLK